MCESKIAALVKKKPADEKEKKAMEMLAKLVAS